MDIGKIFSSPEVAATFLGAFISFPLGVLFTFLIQLLIEKRQKLQITYFTKTEVPLTLSQTELRNKLKISYDETEIKQLYIYKLSIKNTGRKVIENQIFTCMFPQGTHTLEIPHPITNP